ncbi:hypothetical protein RGQ29_030657 [Quercus rubra]|uniref:Uncharacterized protein n=1 Tax=Quercus rubra TaxID=3512 RepID=A0AAN7EI36_QUERU|nr:hypothetical protein RGQ29_030657 [Quercus rubra]
MIHFRYSLQTPFPIRILLREANWSHHRPRFKATVNFNGKELLAASSIRAIKVQKTSADSTNTESSGTAFIGQPQQQFAIPAGPSNLPFPQSPHCIFVPFQTPGANVTYGDRFGSNLNIPDSQLEAQKKFLSNQIEVMQNQLRLLQKPKVEENREIGPTSSSDSKGKNVAASTSSSVSDCGRHGETEVDK